MRASRFSEEQVINVKEAAGGIAVPEIYRKHGISSWTFYRWKRYSGLDISEAKRLRALESENARLKRLVANYALDNQILKQTLEKSNSAHRAAGLVRSTAGRYGISARRACRLVGLDRSNWVYGPKPDSNAVIRLRLMESASRYPCYGALILYQLLKREG